MVVALAVAAVSLLKLGLAEPSAWATVAAALAVVAAVASAWTSQRVLELQEDSLAPNPVPVIDLRRRYELAQFRVTNHGGGSAHDVKITWQQQLRDAEGKDVLLGRDVAIPVIPAGESASVLLGSSHSFVKTHQATTFRGTIEYSNASGRPYRKLFVVTAEHERVALTHDEETPKTLRELQKLPDELKAVARAIGRVEGTLERAVEQPQRSRGDDDG